MTDETTLRALLARVAPQACAALREFRDAAAGRWLALVGRLLGDRAAAEDVVQDTVVTVWTRAAQFPASQASPMAGLTTPARHRAIDLVRRHRPATPLTWQDGDGREGRGARLKADADGLTHDELAARLGRPLGAVKNWIRRSLLQRGGMGPRRWRQLAGVDAQTQLPQKYIGVLATPEGRHGLPVSSLRRGCTADLEQVSPVPVPPGLARVLRSLDARGRPRALAPLPSPPFAAITLPQPAQQQFNAAVELAVSVEPSAALPRRPGGPFVYRDLCGRLWPALRR